MPKKKKQEEKIYSDAYELAWAIEDTVKKIFPDSYIKCKYTGNFGYAITFRFAIGANIDEWVNGIYENDPVKHLIYVGLGQFGSFDDTGIIPEKLTIETRIGGYLLTTATRQDIRFSRNKKKTVNSPAKVVAWFKEYFTTVKEVCKENLKEVDKLKLYAHKLI